MGFGFFKKKKQSSFSITPVSTGSGAGRIYHLKPPKDAKEQAALARKVELLRYQKTKRAKLVRGGRAFSEGVYAVSDEFGGIQRVKVKKKHKTKTRVIRERFLGDSYLDPILRSSVSNPASGGGHGRLSRSRPQRYDPSGLNLVPRDFDLL